MILLLDWCIICKSSGKTTDYQLLHCYLPKESPNIHGHELSESIQNDLYSLGRPLRNIFEF